jgi:hypothetical protein
MAADTTLNAVISQGGAVAEVHNVRKNVLDSNQHFLAQLADDKKKEERSKVAETHGGDKIEIRGDERRESRDEGKQGKSGKPDGKPHGQPQEKGIPADPSSNDGNLIDIKV